MVKAGKLLPLILCLQGIIFVNAQTVYHTLQKGETLYSLSRQYNVTVQDLIELNDIDSPESLSEGFRLIISTGSSQENDGNSIEKNDFSDNVQYTVKKGDTFYRIARAHNMSVNELMSLNDFSGSSILKPGDVLVVKEGGQTQTVPQPIEERSEAVRTVMTSADLTWPVEGAMQTLTGKLRGVTIQAAEASLVQSVASGKVVWTGPYRGFGQVVLIDVDGYIYLYGGNDDIFVNVGEYVPAGSRIGRLGNSGLASRTVDMYFSVFKDGVPVSVVSAPRG